MRWHPEIMLVLVTCISGRFLGMTNHTWGVGKARAITLASDSDDQSRNEKRCEV